MSADKYLDAEIKYILENNIADPSSSSWASQCLFVPKSENVLRFCSDFSKVNSVTKPNAFPFPRMDNYFDEVVSAFVNPSCLYSYKVKP